MISAGTPPKYASMRVCEPIQSGSVCVHVASVKWKLLAPRTPTKSCAAWSSTVIRSTTSMVWPA